MLFDLLIECDAMQDAVRQGRAGFGINHVMVGPINKTLDLVVTRIPPGRRERDRGTFAEMAQALGIVLDDEDRRVLAQLPLLEQDHRDDDSEVAIALEAKACMTEHLKSLPRLHAEILATGYLAKRAVPQCISVSYSLVNCATSFVSPSGKDKANLHGQPECARRVVDMIDRAVPTLTESRDYGYDVVGVTLVNCRNDGSPVTIVEDSRIGAGPQHHLHYSRMIRSLCSQFRGRFGR